jgi:K+-sensing histidine kinase KdpD
MRDKLGRGYKDVGVGLAICQSIVEAHGGRIRASNNSALGGARFSFDLLTRRVQ